MRRAKFGNAITVWRRGKRDVYGNYQWSQPFVLDCRIEDRQRMFNDAQGKQVLGRSVIYTEEDSLILGDYVIQGDHSVYPVPVGGAFEVKDRQTIPNLRHTRVEYSYTI